MGLFLPVEINVRAFFTILVSSGVARTEGATVGFAEILQRETTADDLFAIGVGVFVHFAHTDAERRFCCACITTVRRIALQRLPVVIYRTLIEGRQGRLATFYPMFEGFFGRIAVWGRESSRQAEPYSAIRANIGIAAIFQ